MGGISEIPLRLPRPPDHSRFPRVLQGLLVGNAPSVFAVYLLDVQLLLQPVFFSLDVLLLLTCHIGCTLSNYPVSEGGQSLAPLMGVIED